MSLGLSASDRELLHELEAVHEGEGECEYEGEAFLGPLAGLATRALQSPALRSVALRAARAALGALGESESEWEGEDELNPVRKVYPDAMLEHLAHQAMVAESESEAAEAFLPLIPLVAGKLLPLAAKAIPLAAKALPKIASTVSRVVPQLTRGVSNVTRTLYRNLVTRPLMRAIPTIAQRTVGSIAGQVARGQPVTAQAALRTLARQTAATLASPRRCSHAVQRSRALDRQFHRAAVVATRPAPARGACPHCGGAGVVRPLRRT
jgi:hypothetical protein